VIKSAYDTLLRSTPHDLSKPFPELATSFTASPDGKTFTFALRRGVKFASGNPFTSADVAFSLNRDNNINAGAANVMAGLSVSTPDAFTVVVTSPDPNLAVPVEMTQFNAAILDSVAPPTAWRNI